MECLLKWDLGQTQPVFFVLYEKKRPLVHILHFALKYVGEFRVEDHHAMELVAFLGEHTERRKPPSVLIHPGNLKTLRKETKVHKYGIETWEYYEYPENCYIYI